MTQVSETSSQPFVATGKWSVLEEWQLPPPLPVEATIVEQVLVRLTARLGPTVPALCSHRLVNALQRALRHCEEMHPDLTLCIRILMIPSGELGDEVGRAQEEGVGGSFFLIEKLTAPPPTCLIELFIYRQKKHN